MDARRTHLLAETLRKTMTDASGAELDAALVELGWPDMLAEMPEHRGPDGVPAARRDRRPRLGAQRRGAPRGGRPSGGTLPLPYAGGSWVVWHAPERADRGTLDSNCRCGVDPAGDPTPARAGRRALGWWLLGTGRAMLALAREHALDRTQFGRPLASFQAVRHRLAETLVALEGAEATLGRPPTDDLGSLLAKAAAGQAALTAASTASRSWAGSASPPNTTCTGTSDGRSCWTACSAAPGN